MREVRTEVRVFQVTAECENCLCKMAPTGVVFMTYPAKHEYKCPICLEKRTSTTSYPYRIFEEIPG